MAEVYDPAMGWFKVEPQCEFSPACFDDDRQEPEEGSKTKLGVLTALRLGNSNLTRVALELVVEDFKNNKGQTQWPHVPGVAHFINPALLSTGELRMKRRVVTELELEYALCSQDVLMKNSSADGLWAHDDF